MPCRQDNAPGRRWIAAADPERTEQKRNETLSGMGADTPFGAKVGGPRCPGGWCSRPESNRYDLAIDGFSYLPQLSLPLRLQRLGSGLSLHHCRLAIGAARLVSTPSEFLRLGSGLASAQNRSLAGSVPRIWAVLLSTFPLRHSNRLSPLRLPIPPRELTGFDI
jgi:hypothetical protein